MQPSSIAGVGGAPAALVAAAEELGGNQTHSDDRAVTEVCSVLGCWPRRLPSRGAPIESR